MALIWGETEVDEGTVTIKPLRGQGQQITLPLAALPEALNTALSVAS